MPRLQQVSELLREIQNGGVKLPPHRLGLNDKNSNIAASSRAVD